MADELDAMFPAEHQVAEPDKVETVVEPQEPQAEAIPPEPVEPDPKPEPIAESEPQKDQMVPLAALLDDRDKRKAIAEERDRYKRELDEMRNQPQQVPDALDDPAGYNAYVQSQIADAVQRQRLDMSWHFAVKEHGKDATEAARTWAQERAERDPVFRNQLEAAIATEALPVDWLIQQHRSSEAVGKLGGKTLDDWFNEELARRNITIPSATPAAAQVVATTQPAPKPQAPPRSIAGDASAPSRGQSDAPFNVFDGLLTR